MKLKRKILPLKLSELKDRRLQGILIPENENTDLDQVTEEVFLSSNPPLLLSSVYGKISVLILFFPTNGAYDRYPFVNLLRQLMSEIKGKNRLFLLTLESAHHLSKEDKEALECLAARNGNKFETLILNYNNLDLSLWVRDLFLPAIREENGKQYIYLLEPKDSGRNFGVVGHLTKELNKRIVLPDVEFKYHQSLISFDGGNVLKGDKFVLVGAHQTNYQNLKQYGELYFGKYIIYLETSPILEFTKWANTKRLIDGYYNEYNLYRDNQVLYHLDLFITLAGEQRGKQIIIVGNPVIGFDMNKGMSDGVKKLIKGLVLHTRKAIDEIIVSMKKQLHDYGILFEIHRNPMPLVYYDYTDANNRDCRRWCFASYNNALLEVFYDDKALVPQLVKHVILPVYGISSDYRDLIDPISGFPCGNWTELYQYDLENIWKFEELGFQITTIDAHFHSFIYQSGALHCVTNCLKRGE